MFDRPYVANLNTAIVYLKSDKLDLASESVERAFAQVLPEEKTADNIYYLKILVVKARVAIDRKQFPQALALLEEGLKLKANHADLLYLQASVMESMNMDSEAFMSALRYIVAIEVEDAEMFSYEYANDVSRSCIIMALPALFKKLENKETILALMADLKEKMPTSAIGEVIDRIQAKQ